jgi:4-amino-4-deoxy-L-arabinose transferase-like glycosyltransferase
MGRVSPRPPFAWRSIVPPVAIQLVLLLALSPLYGYERDELYFRMLAPAWGYVDQPPLTPLLLHGLALLVDQVWVARILGALVAAASVLLVVAIAREVGGGRLAQTIAAWGAAFATFTLVFGHSFLTGTLDLLVWPAVVLGAIRAVVRDDGRWWLLAGAAAGAGLSNKLLVAYLLLGLLVGLLVVGPRRQLARPWLWAGVALLVVLAAPDIVYQLTHGLPQLRMGAALAARRGSGLVDLPYLALLITPIAIPVWIAGIVAPFRRRSWHPLRFVPIAFVVVVVCSVVGGGQMYYPFEALLAVFALGCVPVADWAERAVWRTRTVRIAFWASAVITSVIALPIVPASLLRYTPLPAINQATADQVGWPELAAAVDAAGAGAPAGTIVVTTNYGEAGAIARYSTRFADTVRSGHNALGELPPPRTQPPAVIVVGAQLPRLRGDFDGCDIVSRIDDGIGVDNEEQGQPIALCTGLRVPIATLLASARHRD